MYMLQGTVFSVMAKSAAKIAEIGTRTYNARDDKLHAIVVMFACSRFRL